MMLVESIRIDRDLDSLIRNDFEMFASRKYCPQESSWRPPNVPYSPGLGFTSAVTADVPSVSRKEPGVPHQHAWPAR